MSESRLSSSVQLEFDLGPRAVDLPPWGTTSASDAWTAKDRSRGGVGGRQPDGQTVNDRRARLRLAPLSAAELHAARIPPPVDVVLATIRACTTAAKAHDALYRLGILRGCPRTRHDDEAGEPAWTVIEGSLPAVSGPLLADLFVHGGAVLMGALWDCMDHEPEIVGPLLDGVCLLATTEDETLDLLSPLLEHAGLIRHVDPESLAGQFVLRHAVSEIGAVPHRRSVAYSAVSLPGIPQSTIGAIVAHWLAVESEAFEAAWFGAGWSFEGQVRSPDYFHGAVVVATEPTLRSRVFALPIDIWLARFLAACRVCPRAAARIYLTEPEPHAIAAVAAVDASVIFACLAVDDDLARRHAFDALAYLNDDAVVDRAPGLDLSVVPTM